MGMTVKDAILTLNANAVIACERAGFCSATVKTVEDALDIINDVLKEHEAVEPEVEVLNEIDRLYRCPKCHKCFFYEKQKYCDQCGQKVKWE